MSDAPAERRQRLYRTEAIVLKRRDYGEADRLLTVFTPNYGKLVLLGQGSMMAVTQDGGAHFTLVRLPGRATLMDMVRKKPRNSLEFRQVSGVGEVKAGRYAAAFLARIAENG